MTRIIRLSLFFVITMTIGVSAAFGYLCWMQASSFVNVPKIAFTDNLSDYGLPNAEAITLSTSDDLTIHGWYIAPNRENGATIIFVHGHGGNLSTLLSEAQYFTDLGYGTVLFDLRGHGASDDAPVTMGLHEVRDVRAVVDFLLAQGDVNPERIAIYGNSMGAATSILSASQIPEISLIVADASYSSIHDVLTDMVPERTGLPAFIFPDVIVAMSSYQSGADYRLVSPIDALHTITQPIVFMHGTRDGLIPFHHSEELFAVASEPKLLHIVEGAGHTDAFEYDVSAYEAVVLPFIERFLVD